MGSVLQRLLKLHTVLHFHLKVQRLLSPPLIMGKVQLVILFAVLLASAYGKPLIETERDVKSGSCTKLGGDRFGPNLGGCCPGLKEVNEARPKSNAVFCEPGHPNHGKGCWSRVKMCRSVTGQ